MLYDTMETELVGTLIMAGDDNGLHHLNFFGGKHPLVIHDTWQRAPGHFREVKTQLADYFAGTRRRFDLTLFLTGTPFQRKVWAALRDIPYGQVVSYQWIADRIGNPRAVRAVGAANGQNPISIIVPCHRVIGKNGSLTGYGGGLDVKQRLIRLENREFPLSQQASLPW